MDHMSQAEVYSFERVTSGAIYDKVPTCDSAAHASQPDMSRRGEEVSEGWGEQAAGRGEQGMGRATKAWNCCGRMMVAGWRVVAMRMRGVGDRL